MLHENYFSHDLIRKYVILVGTLFNEIQITRTDGQVMSVPISYGPRDKMLARLDQDPTLDRPYSQLVPRIAFEMTNLEYDSKRKFSTVNRVIKKIESDKNRAKYLYEAVPYNLYFDVSIIVKNATDGTQIVEQILPMFTPSWTTPIELVPELGITEQIPVTLVSCKLSDTYDDGFKNRRAIVWDLGFIVTGYMFGPVRTKKLIKFAKAKFDLTGSVTSDPIAEVDVRPGLTSDGKPTSDSSKTIDSLTISMSDDFGYITEIKE